METKVSEAIQQEARSLQAQIHAAFTPVMADRTLLPIMNMRRMQEVWLALNTIERWGVEDHHYTAKGREEADETVHFCLSFHEGAVWAGKSENDPALALMEEVKWAASASRAFFDSVIAARDQNPPPPIQNPLELYISPFYLNRMAQKNEDVDTARLGYDVWRLCEQSLDYVRGYHPRPMVPLEAEGIAKEWEPSFPTWFTLGIVNALWSHPDAQRLRDEADAQRAARKQEEQNARARHQAAINRGEIDPREIEEAA